MELSVSVQSLLLTDTKSKVVFPPLLSQHRLCTFVFNFYETFLYVRWHQTIVSYFWPPKNHCDVYKGTLTLCGENRKIM